MNRLLVVSNGHGEDLIAAEIIRRLDGIAVTAFPLVGLGEAYPGGVELLSPRQIFPSGGFAFRHGLRGLRGDLRSGFIRFWFAQRRTVAAQRGRFDLVVAVGDLYCLVMASRAAVPTVMVATAESVANARYGPLHLRLLRRRARQVFTRDAPTAAFLAARGIPATYAGNVMLDCLHPMGADFGLPPESPVVVLLPGSRSEASRNAVLLSRVAARVAGRRPDAQFLMTVARTVDGQTLGEALRGAGGTIGQNGEIVFGPSRILTTGAFADAALRATVVVGLAGTANEQAAGLGKPVVAFPGPGPQFTPAFMEGQRKLLGEALVTVRSPADAADAVLRLLDSPAERARRGQTGVARMGSPGAAARIARALGQSIAARR